MWGVNQRLDGCKAFLDFLIFWEALRLGPGMSRSDVGFLERACGFDLSSFLLWDAQRECARIYHVASVCAMLTGRR